MSKPRQYIFVVDEGGYPSMIKLSEIAEIIDNSGRARVLLRGGYYIDTGEELERLRSRREQADSLLLPVETATSKRSMKQIRLAMEAMETEDLETNCP
jgi:hypothetical protein